MTEPKLPTTWSRLYSWVTIATTFATLAASAIAFVGVFVWIDEKSDREDERIARAEEREVREADVVGKALQIIAAESRDGLFSNKDSGQAQWAIEALAKIGARIIIEAEQVDLVDVAIDCADFEIKTNLLTILRSRFRAGRMELTADTITTTLGSFVDMQFVARVRTGGATFEFDKSGIADVTIFDAGAPSNVSRDSFAPVRIKTTETIATNLTYRGRGGSVLIEKLGADKSLGESFQNCSFTTRPDAVRVCLGLESDAQPTLDKFEFVFDLSPIECDTGPTPRRFYEIRNLDVPRSST